MFYYLTGTLTRLFGTTHITFRLPALAGFALMCLCLYHIVRRFSGPAGVLAMLLPLVSGARYYAAEGRGYGLMLGFSTLALLCWLRAAEGERRKLFLPLLAFSLAAAVSSHYYAILILAPLGAAELVRTWIQRKWDIPMWLALGAAFLPIALFWSTIRSARGYSAHFWASPEWSAVSEFFFILGFGINIVLAAAALAMCLPSRTAGGTYPVKQVPLWQRAVFPLFAMLPLSVNSSRMPLRPDMSCRRSSGAWSWFPGLYPEPDPLLLGYSR